MATDYVLTGAAVFTNADPNKTLETVLLEGVGTKDHFSYETGVKYKKIIPYISNVDLDISTGDNTGYLTGSGSTTIKDITIETVPLSIREHYKPQSIQKYVSALSTPGSSPAELPLADVILRMKGTKLFADNEKFIWQADTSTTVQTAGTTLNSINGVLAQLRGVAGGYGNGATSFQSLTDASVLEHVKVLVQKVETTKPEFTTIDTVLAMSPANFTAYTRALYNLNGTVTKDTVGADGKGLQEAYVPGTKIKVVSEIGLNGKNNIVLTFPENIIVGYDLVDENEKLEMLYNPYAGWHELKAWYKLGAKVVDPSLCFVTQ
jgi:hypothetical protein